MSTASQTSNPEQNLLFVAQITFVAPKDLKDGQCATIIDEIGYLLNRKVDDIVSTVVERLEVELEYTIKYC